MDPYVLNEYAICMETPVDIPNGLLRAIQRASGTRTKEDAITVAVREYLRVRQSVELTKLLGTLEEFMDQAKLHAQRNQG